MSRVLVTRLLPQGSLGPVIAAGHEIVAFPGDLPPPPAELVAAVRDVDAMICLLTDRIDRKVIAAGLDVYEQEPGVHADLLAAPRTVLLPRIGSATVETRTAMAKLAANGVVTALAGGTPANAVRLLSADGRGL